MENDCHGKTSRTNLTTTKDETPEETIDLGEPDISFCRSPGLRGPPCPAPVFEVGRVSTSMRSLVGYENLQDYLRQRTTGRCLCYNVEIGPKREGIKQKERENEEGP